MKEGRSGQHQQQEQEQNGGSTQDGRNCWRTARERQRLRARYHIRERVKAGTDVITTRTLLQKEASWDFSLFRSLIQYIKAGDRSKFSLSFLDQQFHLVSGRLPMAWLKQGDDDNHCAAGSNLWEHSLQLTQAWFGLEYSQRLQRYMESLETFTLMEYAVWMGKYSIVGAFLLAGVNPCVAGYSKDQRRNWEETMGSLITQRFFDCFPLLLSTYIVKRAVELRWDFAAAITKLERQVDCKICFSTGRDKVYFLQCQHVVCERCFWEDLLKKIDDRGDFVDVVVCPYCGERKADVAKNSVDSSCNENEDNQWRNLKKCTPRQRKQRSLSLFQSLPADRNVLKSSKRKKKKLSENEQWATSWNDAVLPSLGSTQAVRRDKFVSFVERNSIPYVRGALIAGVDVDGINEYGQTALYISCWHGDAELVQLLLEFGASASLAANDGFTPLQISLILGHDLKIFEAFGYALPQDGYEKISSFVFPANLPQARPGQIYTIIPLSTDHPGAGSYFIDNALSQDQIQWLLDLHHRVPVEVAQKKKAGLCSDRSYFCDASGLLLKEIEKMIKNVELCHDHEPSQVFPHMRFLHYSVAGTTLNPHVDICRVDPESGIRSTHTLIIYLTDCETGGETSLLVDVSGEGRNNFLHRISPKRGRVLLFPHGCPHEGNEVKALPKILLRGEVYLPICDDSWT